MLRGGFDVHVVHAHAGAADHAQFRRGFDDFARDFGFGTDDQRDGVGDDGQQFRLRQPFGQHDDLKFRPLLQQRDAFRRNRITNDNFHSERRASVGDAPGKVKQRIQKIQQGVQHGPGRPSICSGRHPCRLGHKTAPTSKPGVHIRSPGWKPGDTAAKDGCRYGGSVRGVLPKGWSAGCLNPQPVAGGGGRGNSC